MGQTQYIAGFVMLAIFCIAIFGYINTFADDNEVYINLVEDDAQISTIKTSMENNVTVYYQDTNSTASKFQGIQLADDEATSPTLVSNVEDSPKQIGFSAMTLAFNKIFGSNTAFGIILTLITSTIIFFGVLYVIKTLKGGNPE